MIRRQPDYYAEMPSDIPDLIHELQIHQTELEIQNEELKRTTLELADLRSEFEDLFDFAPCGYVILSDKGIIKRINLKGIALLGTNNRFLLHSGFSQFIVSNFVDDFISARKKALKTGQKQGVELQLKRENGPPLWVQAEIEANQDDAKTMTHWRVVLVDISEQKRTKQKLHQAELQASLTSLDQTQNIAKVGNWSWDIASNRIKWSDQIYKIFKTPRVAPSYALAKNFVHPSDLNVWENKIERAVKKKEPFSLVYRAVRSDAVTIWAHMVFNQTFNERGEFTGFHGTVQDITERKQAEIDLRVEEEKYRILFESSKDANYISTKEGTLIEANQSFLDLFGYTQENLPGWRVQDIYVNFSDRTKFIKQVEKYGYVREHEVKLRHRNGMEMDCKITATVRRSSDGNVVGYQGIIRDVTEGKMMEEELRESEEKYRGVYEASKDGILMVDLKGKVLECNPALLDTLGYELKEIQLITIQELLPAKYHRIVTEIVENQMLKRGHCDQFEIEIIGKGGTGIPIAINGWTTTNKKRNIIAMWWVIRNISDQKQAQRHFEEYREQLQYLSGHLLKNREQERKAISREIHDDVGQILTALKMDARWIDSHLQENQKELSNKISRMVSLIGSGIQTVKQISSDLRPDILDNIGIREALDWQVQEFVHRTGLPVEFENCPEELDLDSDRAIVVYRILQEALNNIVRHAQAKKVTISFKAGEDLLKLNVADDGIGFISKKATRTKSLGILGMMERARYIGGKVVVEGDSGNGTKVKMKIPTGDHRYLQKNQ